MKRSRSDPPPPITVEDTGSGSAPQPSPSPTRMTAQARSFSAYEPRPSPAHNDSFLRERRRSTWGHKRQKSPGVEWHEKWTEDTWRDGRVLLIDYVDKEHTGGRRKIRAKECWELGGLKKYYENQDVSQQAALRVIHVQNAPWATRFLLEKFNINASDDLVGTSFGRWAQFDRPKRRGGKPVLSGKTFRPQKDPWRGISRAAFGLDYLRSYTKRQIPDTSGMKMMELNTYDTNEQPCYGYDVYAQRLSVYVQFKDDEPSLPEDPEIRNPYNIEEYQDLQRLKRQYGENGEARIPKIANLDNGSTIILFEHSQSGSVEDTLIGARQEIEQRWRRLTFYLSKEDTEDDTRLAVECMDFVLRDIFKALSYSWEKYLGISETHVGILEDKIYDNPADESRAPELWTNSSLWLKVERLIYIHSDIVKEMRLHLKEVTDGDPREDEHWLASSAEELEKLTTQFQEGVVKPTANLSDLMYKSVGIRDARHSLQLGLSMWRLSWITFIFLPLTFMSGFFGMNVGTFKENPSIKWWFIATVPLFAVVVTGWYGIKHTLASQRQNPLRRGVYENLYTELSEHHPTLWSRRGPRDGVVPVGWWSDVKWRLVTSWFAPDRTIAAKGYDAGDEELGVWSRIKRYLVKRWLRGLKVLPPDSRAVKDLESAVQADLGVVGELLELATPVAMADAEPLAARRLQKRNPLGRFRSLSPARSAKSEGARPSTGRRSDDGNSGVMVEEKSEDERSGDEAERERELTFTERLNVPLYPGGAGIVAGGL